MSFNRPFKSNVRGEDTTAIGIGNNSSSNNSSPFLGNNDGDRKKLWKSFITDLEAKCYDDSDSSDDDDDEQPSLPTPSSLSTNPLEQQRRTSSSSSAPDNDNDNERNEDIIDSSSRASSDGINRPGSMMHSLYMQQLRGNYSTTVPSAPSSRSSSFSFGTSSSRIMVASHQNQNHSLSNTLPLRDWIAHCRKTQNFSIGRHSFGTGSGMIDKTYLEEATRLALSLTKKIMEQHSFDTTDDGTLSLSLTKKIEQHHSFDAAFIVIDNVIVSDIKLGEVSFVNEYNSMSISFLSDVGGHSHSTSSLSERKAIYALGGIFYELFTQGSRLPLRAESRQQQALSSSFSQPSSFDMALKITEGDYDDDYTRNRQKQPRRLTSREGSNHCGHYETLQLAGVPPSISRLVAHMLETNVNEDDYVSSPSLLMGGLFRADQPISLSDVNDDLQQMIDAPQSYLHDSLLMRLEPIIPDHKLYGRVEELRQCLDVAEDAIITQQKQQQQQQKAIIISGFSGCGKTFLVREVRARLETKGWQYLHCKFDQEARPQPLSTITSAFDNFLVDYVCSSSSRNFDSSDYGKQQAEADVVSRITNLLDDDGVDALSKLIPTLKRLTMTMDSRRRGGRGSPEPNGDEISFNTSDAAASKCRLHRLMGLLLKALSTPEHPLLICLDDLQWADTASLELINSLLTGTIGCAEVDVVEVPTTSSSEEEEEKLDERPQILFICCFRSNNNDAAAANSSSKPLDMCIQKMKDCTNIALKEIHLEGLSCADVNDVVSEALCYPRRLTRSLANLIHQKSTGNPLFVKEFLNSLTTENLLTYSLSRHGWIWDEEVIEMKAVSNGVVDLLTSRLSRLPKCVLAGLQVLSCFGHGISLEILVHVRDLAFGVSGVSSSSISSDDTTDIIAGLDLATKELLVTKADHMGDERSSVYSFVHDMIQTTVYQGIKQQERVLMLKKIADTLIARTTTASDIEGRSRDDNDVILFIIVDLINRVSPLNTPEARDRLRYAKLNLLAGEKAIETPDFSSAIEYIESGISFLDAGHWERDYDLSLALFKNAAGVSCSLGKSNQMTKNLNQVFENVRCYEDKLDSMSVLIQSLLMDDKADAAWDHSLQVLHHLGELLPSNLDNEAIQREIFDTHKRVQQISPSDIPVMRDNLKMKAMHFLDQALWSSHHQRSKLFAVVSCRMVKLTLSHGLHPYYSARAISALAFTFTAVLRKYTQGYNLGKLAQALNKSSKNGDNIALVTIGMVSIFKEPIQAMLPTILENYKSALKGGRMTNACAYSMCYVIRAFFSGSSLTSLSKDMVIFCRQMSRHNQIRPYLCLIPVFNAIAKLSGESQNGFYDDVQGYEDNEKNLSKAFEKKDISRCDIIITIEIVENLIFRRIDLAGKIVRQYQGLLDLHGRVQLRFASIYRIFYSGLVAFHCFRATQEQYWLNRGTEAIKDMETWTNECKWNFENKMLLLNTEYYFSIGDFDKATEGYHLSITLARNHRFVCEEAIANELGAYFQLERGRVDLSMCFMKQAIECYQSWGALKKVEILKHTLQNL